MSFQLILGAAFVAVALPLAWASISGRRVVVSAAALGRGITPTLDMRTAILQQSARDRAVSPLVTTLARHARRLTPAGMMAKLEDKLTAAGKQGEWRIEQVLAAKLGLTLVIGFAALMQVAANPSPLVLMFAIAAVGAAWFGPDVILDGKADDRRTTIQRELPDTMDQITIAVEAGLGFEAALARVADTGSTTIAAELARTLQDIQLGMRRADALNGLAQRCNAPDLRRFVSAVKQAEQYGLPIANVLRIQASELRDKRRARAEEHAQKIPVKVLFPLVFFILPTMFIVILGPAVIEMARGFTG